MPHLSRRAAAAAAALAMLAAAGCTDRLPVEPNPALADKDVPIEPEAPPAQYVVLFEEGAEGLADPGSASGVKLGDLEHLNGAVFAYVDDPDALRDDPNVAEVVENFISYPTQAPYPTDALYYQRGWQWAMEQIRADQVPPSVQGQGTRVCIIDSGIDETHQDLRGKVVARTSFVDPAHGYAGPGESPAPLDSNGHGSHVASTVTSNGIGVAAVAPRAQLMAAKVFAASGGATLAAIWDAIAWCADNEADVLNMSIGGLRSLPLSPNNQNLRAQYTAVIQAAREAGTVVVVSAGNDNIIQGGPTATQESWPSALPGTVTVGASAPSNSTFPFAAEPPAPMFDSKAGYSNYGPNIDIWAPGGSNFINRPQANTIGVCSSQRHGGACEGGVFYMSIGGTSMAAPHVAGVAALLASRTAAPRSLARVEAIERCLYATGDPMTVTVGGSTPSSLTQPRVNALRAATEPCEGL